MKNSPQKGFSILELIVAIGIFIVLTTVLLANYNSINRRLALDTLAHQIAQWVRETQVSAMGVRPQAGEFNRGFGLHFSMTDPTQFVYFADFPVAPSPRGNKIYDGLGGFSCGEAGTECVQTISVLRGNSIALLCGELGSAQPHSFQGRCPSGHDELNSVNIVFLRPDPDATIFGGVRGMMKEYGNVKISVRSVIDYERTISVWTTGQVTVD
jgi:hypothetical protein